MAAPQPPKDSGKSQDPASPAKDSSSITIGSGSQGAGPRAVQEDEVRLHSIADNTQQQTHDEEGVMARIITESQTPSQNQYMEGWPFYILFFTLLLSGLLSALNASMLATATPSITNSFHSLKDIGWYGSSYLIAKRRVSNLPIFQWAYICFIAVFEIGTLIAAVSVNSPMLIVGRAICGIGGSGIMTGATGVISIVRPLEKRPFLIGIIMGCIAIGQVAGPLMGGALAEVTWRWIFYINLPLGGIVMALFTFVARIPPRPSTITPMNTREAAATAELSSGKRYLAHLRHKLKKIDFVGFVLFAGACAVLLMGLEYGGTTYSWRSSVVIGLICGGGVLFGVWGVWSYYQGDRALLPFRLITQSRINMFCGLVAFTQSSAVFILTYYLPIWFQGIKGASPIMSGVMLLPTIISQMVAAIPCGWVVQKTGYYLPEIIMGNALVAIASGLFTTFVPSTTSAHWIGFQVLGGLGRGMVLQLLITVIQANVPQKDIPLGISYVMFCQYFGGALFICAARTILTSSLPKKLAKYAPNADPQAVLNMGVTDFRKAIPAAELPGVLYAYDKALVDVWYLQLALVCVAFTCCFFLGWKDIRKKPNALKKSDVETANRAEKRAAAPSAEK